MTEFELKFEIPRASLQRVVTVLKDGKAARERLQARYFDTEDGALARNGVVVRVRKEGRRWVQTAKGPTQGPTKSLVERLEHNVSLARQPKGAEPDVDLSRHAGTPVGKAIAKALNLKLDAAYPKLALLYETDVQRVTRVVAVEGSLVEIALDQGRILSGNKSMPICELEVELKTGKPEHAVALARQWCAEHGLSLSSITKSMKGQRLRNAQPWGPAVSAAAPAFHRDATGADIAVAVLQSCVNQILPNASELAAPSTSPDPIQPEHIHQLRVGIRRLRTALRELEGLTDAFDPAWEPALVQVFRQLGQHRDHGHLERDLQPTLLAAGGPIVSLGHSGKDIPDPAASVRTPAFQDVLLGLIGFVHRSAPQVAGNDAVTHNTVKKVLRSRLKKLRFQALKQDEKFTKLNDTDQHRVRKRLKRLRYLSEFSAPFFKAGKVNAFIEALKPAQDALGLYNDELMALQAYRSLAIQDPRAWFGVGWLAARRVSNAKHCLKEIEAFASGQVFWK